MEKDTGAKRYIVCVITRSGLKLWGTYSITESMLREFFRKWTLNLSSASTQTLLMFVGFDHFLKPNVSVQQDR